jgi:hypothetical protein
VSNLLRVECDVKPPLVGVEYRTFSHLSHGSARKEVAVTRSHFCIVAGCLALAGFAGARPSPEDEARALVKKLGGICTTDDKRPERPVVAINL